MRVFKNSRFVSKSINPTNTNSLEYPEVNANASNYEANFIAENIGLPEPENDATGIGGLGRR